MKQFIQLNIVGWLLVCSLPAAFAQQQNCGDKGTRTNPDNPFDVRAQKPLEQTQFLNNGKFDWRTQYFDWWDDVNTLHSPVLNSPFYTGNNPNLVGYIERTPPDNKPEDGWELITYHFGKYNDGSFQAEAHPRFILYNRYTGVLRIFFYVNRDVFHSEYQTARIRLSFFDNSIGVKQPALLSYVDRFAYALDAYTKKQAFANINQVNQEYGEWIVADFPMAYDPCVCNNFYELMWIHVEMIETSTITLNGKLGTTDQYQVASGNETNFTTNASYNNALKSEKVVVGTHTFEVMEQGQKAIHSAAEFKDDLEHLLTQEKSSTAKDMKLEDIAGFEALLGVAPYVGAAAGLIDFFVGGGKESNTEGITPISFEAGINLSGTIETVQPNTEQLLVVPGSIPKPGTPEHYQPMYNEALGVFNLVETPELEYIDYTWADWASYHCNNEMIVLPAVRHYKVKSPIKYAVNPASHLAIEKFDATFTITYGQDMWASGIERINYGGINRVDYFEDQLCMAAAGYKSSPPTFRLFPRPFEEFPFLAVPGVTYEQRLNRIGMGIETWNKDWPNSGEVVLNTTYLPIGGIQEQSFMLYRDGYWNDPATTLHCYDQLGRFPDPKIRFKVNIVFRRTDNPNAQRVNFVATYEVKLTPNPLMATNWQDFTFTPFEYTTEETPAGLVITGLTYKSQPTFSSLLPVTPMGTQYPNYFRKPVDVTLENTTVNYDVTALHNIYIGSNVTFPPNPSGITLLAGNKISISPQSQVSPEVDMQIGYTRASCSLNPESLKTTDFSSICGSSANYDPVVHSKWSGQGAPPVAGQPKTYNTDVAYTIYPNPAQGQASIRYGTHSENEQVRLSILDMMGKECQVIASEAQVKGEHSYMLNTAQLAPGVYFSRLERNGEVVTKKFTVLK